MNLWWSRLLLGSGGQIDFVAECSLTECISRLRSLRPIDPYDYGWLSSSVTVRFPQRKHHQSQFILFRQDGLDSPDGQDAGTRLIGMLHAIDGEHTRVNVQGQINRFWNPYFAFVALLTFLYSLVLYENTIGVALAFGFYAIEFAFFVASHRMSTRNLLFLVKTALGSVDPGNAEANANELLGLLPYNIDTCLERIWACNILVRDKDGAIADEQPHPVIVAYTRRRKGQTATLFCIQQGYVHKDKLGLSSFRSMDEVNGILIPRSTSTTFFVARAEVVRPIFLLGCSVFLGWSTVPIVLVTLLRHGSVPLDFLLIMTALIGITLYLARRQARSRKSLMERLHTALWQPIK